MELDFDADFVEADEESLGTLVRRNSKVERGTNLKENVASDTVKPEMNTNLVTSGGENSDINSASTSLEKAANTCERETKMNTNFGSSDEESSITLVLNISELHTGRNLKESEASGCKTMNSDIEVVFNEVQNSEVKLGGKIFEAEQSQVTTAEHTERHENKEYFDGARLIAYPLSMDASNKSVVLKDMPVDSTHLKASLQPSVYYVEDKGSQINANLDRGSETIEYESKETENQLRENQIRILENSALEGKVEDIVKILKEQQSHDVICPNCGACITERIILRKRKRTSLVSEGNPDGQTAVSEEEHEITEDQSNRLEMSIEHYEETEAYGCLACLHIIIERGVKFFRTKSEHGNNSLAKQYSSENLQDSRMLVDKEKDSFYCFPFYPWGHNKQGVTADYAIEASQRKRGEDAPHQNVALNAVPTTTTGAGILLKNDGEKTTTVNEVGLDEDHTVAGNVNLDSQLNLSDKDDDTVEEFTEKPPNRAASHPNITIQSITSHTSTTATSRVNNVKIKETSYTATGTTKTTSCLDGDSEFLQQEEQYPRLPNIEVTEGRLGIPTSSSIPALNDGQNVQAEAKFEVPKENVTEKTSDRHVQHASDTAGNNVLPRSGSDEKDYLCSCIPVSLPTIWSWSSKELIADEQLKKPLLADLKDKLTIDEEVLVTLRDDQQRKVIFPSKVDSVESSSSLETQDPATLVQKKVDDSVRLNKVDDSVSQSSEISPDSSNIASPTDGRAAVVINIRQSANTEAADPGVVTDWDLLKSIVYGGLTVSITSLGVVSSAAGGDAKTLTVIAISLANLVAGFFLIIKDILYLHHFDKIKFEDSVGHSFLFNGFIAIVSYLVFGSLAPITYGFSFQNSDDTLYKFLAASLVSLISIILLALGKARVANKSYNIVAQEAYKTYIRVVILYVVTGFWASFIGFFAGKYIKKLLEKWGFTTD